MKFFIFPFCLFFIITFNSKVYPALLINEFVTNTTDDWVELTLKDSQKKSMEISNLYVTMYYGTNEPLAESSVTIYSYNREETPYDDRFIVIHLTIPDLPDETDLTGDTNKNGHLDLYCNNYYNSLWNSDGVVSIDSDDDPKNNGIIDFVSYSNRDGSINSTIAGYIEKASGFNQWSKQSSGNPQINLIDIGKDGLDSNHSISRKNSPDTNSLNDFAITTFLTPGKENIFRIDVKENELFSIDKTTATIVPGSINPNFYLIKINVAVLCNIRIRIFNSIGEMVEESPLFESVSPGIFSYRWDYPHCKKQLITGLYYMKITASSSTEQIVDSKNLYIVYRKK